MVALEQLSRVAVIGTSCSGKTTFARSLAAKLATPHIELDALHWGPNWTPRDPEVFRASVDDATNQPRWVCDGNYRVVRDLVWSRATTIVWLNYSFPIVFRRAVTRTVTRCLRHTPLYAGNRETLRGALLSRDSILLWVLQTHSKNRREYSQRLYDSQETNAQIVDLKSPRFATRFLAEIEQHFASQPANYQPEIPSAVARSLPPHD